MGSVQSISDPIRTVEKGLQIVVLIFFMFLSFWFAFRVPAWQHSIPHHADYAIDLNLKTLYWTFDNQTTCTVSAVNNLVSNAVSTATYTYVPVPMVGWPANGTSDTCRDQTLGQNYRVQQRCETETGHQLYELMNSPSGYFIGTRVNMQFLIWLTVHITAMFYVFLIPNNYTGTPNKRMETIISEGKVYFSVGWLIWGLFLIVLFFAHETNFYKWQLPISNVIFGFAALIVSFAFQMVSIQDVVDQEHSDNGQKQVTHHTEPQKQIVVPGDAEPIYEAQPYGNGLNVNSFLGTALDKTGRFKPKYKMPTAFDFNYESKIMYYLLLELGITFPLLIIVTVGVSYRVVPQWMVESFLFRFWIVFGGMALIERMKADSNQHIVKHHSTDPKSKNAMMSRILQYFTLGMHTSFFLLAVFAIVSLWQNLYYYALTASWAFDSPALVVTWLVLITLTLVVFGQYMLTVVETIVFATGKDGLPYQKSENYMRMGIFWVLTTMRIAIYCFLIPYRYWYGALPATTVQPLL